MTQQYLQCGRYRLSIQKGHRPLVMGILNITPNSFSDGGNYFSLKFAISRAEKMITEGVDIIDIGGESSKPGISPLSLKEELKRIKPILHALRNCGKPLSIDTYKPQIMYEALIADVDMINDINGFRTPGAIEVIKNSNVGLCIMHMKGHPKTMQEKPMYTNIIQEISQFLLARIEALKTAGIQYNQLCIDPGFGFGKTIEHNFILLQNLHKLVQDLRIPMLVGISRKSMIGTVTGKPINQRLAGSLSAALIAAAQGAMIIRAHDIAETVDALSVWQIVRTNLIVTS